MSNVTHMPMSENQHGLWLLQTMNPELIAYNVASVFRVQGPLDVVALHRALKRVVRRHPILRTTFAVEDETPVQCVHADLAPQFEHVDVAGIAEDALQVQVQAAHDRPFDLAVGPLVRLTIFGRSINEYIVLFNWHHILLDFGAQAIITQEILDVYQSEISEISGSGEQEAMPYAQEESGSYADFVVWQQEFLAGKQGKRHQQYWTEQLHAPLPMLNFPTDHPYPPQQTYNGGSLPICLSTALSQRILTLAKQEEVTPFVILLSAYTLLLARYSGQEELIVGVATNERIRAPLRFRQTLGHMVNLLPMRFMISDNISFKDLLRHTETVVMSGLFHQNYSFARMVQDTQIERDLSRPPLFEVSFNMPVIDTDEVLVQLIAGAPDENVELISVNGLQIAPYAIRHQEAQVPLHLGLWQQEEKLVGYFKYNTDLFDEATMARMASHLAVLLDGIVSLPGEPVLQLPMLTDAEYHQIVHEWNDTTVDFGPPQTIHAMFEAQVERTPDAVALVFAPTGHDKDEPLTYAELNVRANQLAHHLIELGVKPDTLVAVAMERSTSMVVSLLAILKAGGAYVPIDPTSRVERINALLAEPSIHILLMQSQRNLSTKDIEVAVNIVQDKCKISLNSIENPQSMAKSQHLAYVLHTSGSTGSPKGVMVEHRNIVNYVNGVILRFDLKPHASFALAQSLHFDLGLTMLYPALMTGGRLHILNEYEAKDPVEFTSYLKNNVINYIKITPSHLSSLIDDVIDIQTAIILGGEAADTRWVARVQAANPHLQIFNHFGPTETTVGVVAHKVPSEIHARPIPIGRALPNNHALILSTQPQLVPIGVPGELCIGGAQLARGYLNRPDLTAERFIEHPEFGRLYKTGDLCRWLPDGNIEYIGRTDFQVKIRGFRIELGEIEKVLLAQDGVREVVVLAREDGNPLSAGDKRLVAYVVGDANRDGDTDIAIDTLRQHLAQRLPEYMVPSAFVTLDAMPLTPNGKLDRRALPAPDYTDAQTEFVAPRNALEQQLADIWCHVLSIEQVGIYDNFFSLGGHSLLATRVVSQVRTQLNLDVPLKMLFEASQLAAFAQTINQAQTKATAIIQPVARDTPQPSQLPLSFAQQRLWFLGQLEPNSALYNIPTMIRLEGPLDVEILEKSFRALIERHEGLRTTFDSIDGDPIQVIHAPSPSAAQFTLSVIPVKDEEEAQQRGQVEATTLFNLGKGPLLRVQLLQITETDSLLVLIMYHIISDGWSIGVLLEELTHAYRAYTQGDVPTWPDLPIQYADFAVWQRDYLSGETTGGVLEKQLSFWREHLTGAPALLELPTDRPRPPVQSYRGTRYAFELDTDLTAKLNQLAQRHEATLFMVLLAAFNVLLARYGRQTDVVVGTLIANRNHAEIEGLIGFFINVLVLRTQLEENPSFEALLAQVRHNTLAAYEHQDLPFEQLVDELDPERTLSYNPLYQVMLVLQNAKTRSFALPNLTATILSPDFPFAKLDLTFYLEENNASLKGVVEYNTDLFDEATIARMASHFAVLLNSIVSRPDQPVLQLPLLTDAEYHQIVHEWNDTAVDFGEPQSIHALFEQQVERTPDAVAVVFGTEQQEPNSATLTYRKLNERVNQLAHLLIEKGVGGSLGPEPIVGLLAHRNPNFLIAMLAIFKVGGVYLPLDPRSPTERHRRMVQQSRASLLLVADEFLDVLDQTLVSADCTILSLERTLTQACSILNAINNPPTRSKPDDLAYVIFTSGSTGLPKGAMVEHRGMVNHLYAKILDLELTASSRIAQTASQAFDISVWQFLAGLLVGGTVYIYSDGMALDPTRLLERVENDRISIWETVPSLMRTLLDAVSSDATLNRRYALRALRWLIPTGEALPPELANQWLSLYPHVPLLNAYGPTECSDDVTHQAIHQPLPAATVHTPIGRPVINMRAYVLDQHMQPTPIGVPGELWIGGDGVGRGYINDSDRTTDAFVLDPFSNNPQARLYKTGDLVRYRTDGALEFLNRLDYQVKIHGFRIELGEIENALLAQNDVREVVVLAREDKPGDKRLVAYLVGEAKSDTLRQHLAQRLPDYMVPAAFVELEAMPLTPNGKLDRRALPAPEYTGSASHHVPAETLDETRLLLVWQEVLGVHPIGVEDNFFELGGHSLLAIQLVHQMRQTLQRDISLQQVFKSPTIRGLLRGLDEAQTAITSFVPLRVSGHRAPLFLIHGASGTVFP